ncbi:hypothetical protein HZH68_006036 [Vespula germanica]|uniref:Uncharacterized protein n=1 Tax=Vespula germanica TaxID=30212 RepID=A0A834KC61_VESGE|nr:hypothetical protein HZH68_006036 [Vespula germanica]
MRVYFLIGVIALAAALEDAALQSQIYGDRLDQKKSVIDKIFNIPITAVKQTAVVAQSFTPENKETIDNIFQIPISTLEAVGSLVKTTSSQRLENADEIQRRRQERRDRIQAQREEQRLRREQIQNERLQKKASRYPRHHQKDPFGLNSLTKLFINHHGALYKPHQIHSLLGNYHCCSSNDHGGNNGGNHGSHGNYGGVHEILGDSEHGPNMYQVHEEINEENDSVGTFFGHFSLNSSKDKLQNKVAPSIDKERNDSIFENISTRKKNKSRYPYDEPPLQNKVAPRNTRITNQCWLAVALPDSFSTREDGDEKSER